MECACHCIKCKSIDIESKRVGEVEENGYFDIHHTCKQCHTHFDHLEGNIFDLCEICNYKAS